MKEIPNIQEWLQEAKQSENASKCGMYLVHNGVVRESAKDKVRNGNENALDVKGMEFSYNASKVEQAIKNTYQMDGIYYIKVWLNEGLLNVGDDIMYVLVGGDIRPHIIEALQSLVGTIKKECVIEKEIY